MSALPVVNDEDPSALSRGYCRECAMCRFGPVSEAEERELIMYAVRIYTSCV